MGRISALIPLGIILELACAVLAPMAKAVGLEQSVGNGNIDWAHEQIRAIGIGFPPDGAAGNKARSLAREAAITIAERNLLKALQSVRITSETTVENLVLRNDMIKENVEGILHGATIIHERALADGGYEVVVALHMFGQEQSLSSAVGLPDQFKEEMPTAPAGAPEHQPAPMVVSGDYTGLLIDCRGLKLSPAMCPLIRDEQGTILYPRKDVSPETLNEKGLALYYRSESDAKNSERLGKHPLIIKALRVEGTDSFKFNPVVTSDDAAHILAEDARTKFLDNLAVAFLVDL